LEALGSAAENGKLGSLYGKQFSSSSKFKNRIAI
jgi:hypothetical protein